jgi:hypothetical protein
VVLIVLIVVNVALRYVVGTNYIAMEEMQWHLYRRGLHDRARLRQARRPCPGRRARRAAAPRTRAWIELVGILSSSCRSATSCSATRHGPSSALLAINEVSAAPGRADEPLGIKSVIMLAFVFSGSPPSRLMRVTAFLFGFPRRAPEPTAVTAPAGPGRGPVMLETNEILVIAMLGSFIGLIFTGFPDRLDPRRASP